MGTPGVKMNKDDILDAIVKKGPVISHIANYLNCHRDTIYTWRDRDEDVQLALEESIKKDQQYRNDQDIEIKQKAYRSICHLIDNFDVTATIFALKSKCKWDQNAETGSNYIINDKGTMDARK